MNTLFVEQVEYLMKIQQIKLHEQRCIRTNYSWLCNIKLPTIHLTCKEELLIKEALQRVSESDKVYVLKQLWSWVETDKNLPQKSIYLLRETESKRYLQQLTLSRMNSFRSSLRQLSFRFSKVVKSKRSVSFAEHPTIYSISK